MTTLAKNIRRGWKINGNEILMIHPSTDVNGKKYLHFVMKESPLDLFFYPDDKVTLVTR